MSSNKEVSEDQYVPRESQARKMIRSRGVIFNDELPAIKEAVELLRASLLLTPLEARYESLIPLDSKEGSPEVRAAKRFKVNTGNGYSLVFNTRHGRIVVHETSRLDSNDEPVYFAALNGAPSTLSQFGATFGVQRSPAVLKKLLHL